MATVCFVEFLPIVENEMEKRYIWDEVFRKSNEATGSLIPRKSSETIKTIDYFVNGRKRMQLMKPVFFLVLW
jgi:hypothetical protein